MKIKTYLIIILSATLTTFQFTQSTSAQTFIQSAIKERNPDILWETYINGGTYEFAEVIGDISSADSPADGFPDIILFKRSGSDVAIVSGENGTPVGSIQMPASDTIWIAKATEDITGDNLKEIVLAGNFSSAYDIQLFTYDSIQEDLIKKWSYSALHTSEIITGNPNVIKIIPDINGNGYVDIAVGYYDGNLSGGNLLIIDGFNGNRINETFVDNCGTGSPNSVHDIAVVADVDNDEVFEIAVSTKDLCLPPGAGFNKTHVLSGKDLSPIWSSLGEPKPYLFGEGTFVESVASDLFVVTIVSTVAGIEVQLLFGLDGSKIWSFEPGAECTTGVFDKPYSGLRAIGELTGDAIEDILFSLKCDAPLGEAVYLLDGATGQPIWYHSIFQADDEFDAYTKDINMDGTLDVVILDNYYTVRAIDTTTGSIIKTYDNKETIGPFGFGLGNQSAFLNVDLNNDGKEEAVITMKDITALLF